MPTATYTNIHVRDLKASMDFFTKLGFDIDERFTSEEAAPVVVGESSYVLLVTEPFFRTISNREVADTTTHSEVVLAVQVESKEKVNEIVDAAIAAGGESGDQHAQDEDFMYSRGFRDLDGHMWSVLTMLVPQS